MTALTIARPQREGISAQPVRDATAIAGRALRALPQEMETVIPPIFIALFFFVINIGTLQHLTQSHIHGFDIKAFMLPTAILIGVTGVSRAGSLVLDIHDGYLDRLLLTPVRRLAILVGHMVADVAIACMLTVPILILAFAIGVHIQAGVPGRSSPWPASGAWPSPASATPSPSRPATRRR